MLDLLPQSSLVAFEACRLTHPEVVWHDRRWPVATLLERCAFVIAGDSAEPELTVDAKDRRVFFAERYGGKGMVNNGGGVRCGTRDGLQLKGIGSNVLRGRGSSFWYSHGGATLEEGIREALLSEVCNAVLPHGAVPIHGVIATGRHVAWQTAEGQQLVPGALIIREPALRPAHFMRALYFEPQDATRPLLKLDAVRTREALLKLPQALKGAFRLKAKPDEALNQGLMLLAERLAAQQAASRARKIVHGAVTCSNVALDGRMVDFGTTTAVSDYGRVIVARGFPEMLQEHMGYIPTLRDLHFYCRKYLPQPQVAKLLPEHQLVEHFQRTFSQRVTLEFLQLTGVSEADLQVLPAGLTNAMMQSFDELIVSGNSEPFKLRDMPQKFGRFHLNTVLRTAAFCDEESLDNKLREAIPDDQVRARFVQAYLPLRAAYLHKANSRGARHARQFMALNACRLNSAMPDLYRTPLMERLEGWINEPGGLHHVGPYIQSVVRKARNLLAPASNVTFQFVGQKGELIELKASQPLRGAHGIVHTRELALAVPELLLTHEEVACLEAA